MGSRVSRSTSLTSSHIMSVYHCSSRPLSRTSFCDLSKRQASTPLKIDILGVHKSAQRSKRLPREEVGFASLWVRLAKIVMVAGCDTDILKVL